MFTTFARRPTERGWWEKVGASKDTIRVASELLAEGGIEEGVCHGKVTYNNVHHRSSGTRSFTFCFSLSYNQTLNLSKTGKELKKATALGEYEGDVLVVSHAITISVIAQAVLRAVKAGLGEDTNLSADDPEEEKILSFNVGEVEGFAISSKGVVTLLQNEYYESE